MTSSWKLGTLHGPVTSLLYSGQTLLAGIGRYLHVYVNNKPTLILKVLHYERIHFLKSLSLSEDSTETVACIGIKTFRILKISANGDVAQDSKVWKFSDRILDVKLLNDVELVLLFGFNNVVRFSVYEGEVERIQCDSCCILYSGKILSNSWSEMVVVSGSVFNEILVWTSESDKVRCPVQHTLSGHDGVIFSVDYLSDQRLLCSASDDRSIRLWRLESDDPTLYSAVRTGTFLPTVVMYGHTARIWDVRLLPDVVISIGEDASCCEWNHDGSLRRRVRVQNVKSIRALAVDKTETMVATAGEDGGIQTHHRHHHQEIQSSDLSLPDNNDFPREIKLLTCDTMLVFTDQGRLYSCDLLSETWTLIVEDEEFKGYCAMDVDRGRGLVGIGSKNGLIKLGTLSEPRFVNSRLHDQKVTPLLFTDIQKDAVVATTSRVENKHILVLYLVDLLTLKLEEYRVFDLAGVRHSFINAITTLEDLIVTGDKEGCINCYSLNSGAQTFRAHRKGGISCFLHEDGHLLSAGRDGLLNSYKLSKSHLELVSSSKLQRNIDWIHSLFRRGQLFMSGFRSTVFQVWNVDEKQKLCDIECGGGHRLNSLSVDQDRAVFVYVRSSALVINHFSLSSPQINVRDPVHGKEVTCLAYMTSLNPDDDNDDTDTRHFIASASEDTTCKILAVTGDDVTVMATFATHISAVKSVHVLSGDGSFLVVSCGGRGQVNVERVVVQYSQCHSQHVASYINTNVDVDIRFMCVKTISARTLNPLYHSDFYFLIVACSDGRLRVFSLTPEGKMTSVLESDEQFGCLMDIDIVTVSGNPVVLTGSTSGHILVWDIQRPLISVYLSWQLGETFRETDLSGSSIAWCEQIHGAGISSVMVRGDEVGFSLVSAGEDGVRLTHISMDFVMDQLLVTMLDRLFYDQVHASTVTSVSWLHPQGFCPHPLEGASPLPQGSCPHPQEGSSPHPQDLVTVSSDQRVVIWRVISNRTIRAEPTQVIMADVSDILTCCLWGNNGRKFAMVAGIGVQMLVYE